MAKKVAKKLMKAWKQRASRVADAMPGAKETLMEGSLGIPGLGFVGKHPVMAGIGTSASVPFLMEILGPLLGSIHERQSGNDVRQAQIEDEYARDVRRRQISYRLNAEAERRAALQSAARLAQTDPQMYNEVLAGRRLPQGAMVFGGQPRIDLMEQLALEMASGGFSQPSPEQDLMSMLGA